MDRIKDYYDAFARYYSDRRADGFKIHPEIYDNFFESLAGPLKLIDLGCGPGFEAQRAVEYGFEVTGVDLSPKMVDLFRQRNPGGQGVVASMTKLPFAESRFDAALASFSFIHLSDTELSEGLKEVRRVMTPGGQMLMTVGALPQSERIANVHREAKGLSLKAIDFYFRSANEWLSSIKEHGFNVKSSQEVKVDGSALSILAFIVQSEGRK